MIEHRAQAGEAASGPFLGRCYSQWEPQCLGALELCQYPSQVSQGDWEREGGGQQLSGFLDIPGFESLSVCSAERQPVRLLLYRQAWDMCHTRSNP